MEEEEEEERVWFLGLGCALRLLAYFHLLVQRVCEFEGDLPMAFYKERLTKLPPITRAKVPSHMETFPASVPPSSVNLHPIPGLPP